MMGDLQDFRRAIASFGLDRIGVPAGHARKGFRHDRPARVGDHRPVEFNRFPIATRIGCVARAPSGTMPLRR